MKKEDYRDYATHMFRTYAAWGCRDAEKVRDLIGENITIRHKPILIDIQIVHSYLEHCQNGGKKHIADVLSAVYFVQPKRSLRRGDVSARVRRFSIDYHVSEKQAYLWLREARKAVASAKGLDIE